MDLPSADRRHQVVADPLQPQPALDLRLEPLLRHLDGGVEPEEVGSGQQVHVEHVALDPLRAVQEAAQLIRALGHLGLEQTLQPVDRGHLIRDRTDAADARHDVRHLAEVASAQERLEEPRRLVDLELQPRDLAVVDADVQRALPLHARDDRDLDRAMGHAGSSPVIAAAASASSRSEASRKSGAYPVMKRNFSATCEGVMPKLEEPPRERVAVRRLGGTEASVAPAAHAGADRAAPRAGHGTEARLALGHHHADVAALLALDADRGGGRAGHRALEQPRERREQLSPVDGAPGQLQIHLHVVGHRRRVGQRVDVLGRRVDVAHVVGERGAVAQRLDAAGRRARADRDQEARGRHGSPSPARSAPPC